MPVARRHNQRRNNQNSQNMPPFNEQRISNRYLEDALRSMEASLVNHDTSSSTFTAPIQWETITPTPQQASTPTLLPLEVQEGSPWSHEQVRLARDSWRSHFEAMERELDVLEHRPPTDLPNIAATRNTVHQAWELAETWRKLYNRIIMVIQLHTQLESLLPDDPRRTHTHRVLQLKLDAMRSAVVDVETVLARFGVVPPPYYASLTDAPPSALAYANEFAPYPSTPFEAPPLIDRRDHTRPTEMSVPNPGGTPFIINGNKVKVRIKIATHNHLNIVVSTERGSYAKAVISLVAKRVGLYFYRSENNFREIDHGFKLMDSDRGLIIAERKE